MDGVDAIRRAVNSSHTWFEGTCADITEEQANHVPEGVAHPIGELAAHIVQTEDAIVSGMFQGKPPIWESGGWEQKLGIPNMVMHTRESARGFKGEVAALEPYKQEVYAATAAFLDGLSEAELDREVDGPAGKMPLGEAFGMLLIANNFAHTGEISALKGVLGAKGYAF